MGVLEMHCHGVPGYIKLNLYIDIFMSNDTIIPRCISLDWLDGRVRSVVCDYSPYCITPL